MKQAIHRFVGRRALRRLSPVFAAGLLLVSGGAHIASAQAVVKPGCITQVTVADITSLYEEVKAANPAAYQKLAEDADLRKLQNENLGELLALGCHAHKTGIARNAVTAAELENIRAETAAVEYDKLINKNGGAPFSLITAKRIDAFLSRPENQKKADAFVRVKTELLERSGAMPGRQITPDELAEAKQFFARIQIYDAESRLKAKTLGLKFRQRVRFKTGLQQAQFLARLVSEELLGDTKAEDSEVDEYISEHPELGVEQKRKTAQEVLVRARAGEDFAKLANDHSEDPGNTGPDGNKLGGLYADVPKGRMIEKFERAALTIEPGSVFPDLVETDFGFHVIKLEKISRPEATANPDELTYDVRHVLLATTYKDPLDENASEVPLKQWVRTRIEGDRERAATARIVSENPIRIAEYPFK